jgi:hypothetical protein
MDAISIEDLVYEISSRFDASITPSEVRSLVGSKELGSFDFDDLFEVLSEAGIDHESIESLAAINFDRFVGVGYFIPTLINIFFQETRFKKLLYFKTLKIKKIRFYGMIF